MNGENPVGGGVNISHVGVLHAGDIVGGDKITTTTTTTGTTHGFADEGQKQEFQAQIDQLRDTLRSMKKQVEDHPSMGNDEKDEIVATILERLSSLKGAKDQTATAVTGEAAPASVSEAVNKSLDSTHKFLDTLNALTTKSAAIAGILSPLLARCIPLLEGARHLFQFG